MSLWLSVSVLEQRDVPFYQGRVRTGGKSNTVRIVSVVAFDASRTASTPVVLASPRLTAFTLPRASVCRTRDTDWFRRLEPTAPINLPSPGDEENRWDRFPDSTGDGSTNSPDNTALEPLTLVKTILTKPDTRKTTQRSP